jgi:hypothetical protein
MEHSAHPHCSARSSVHVALFTSVGTATSACPARTMPSCVFCASCVPAGVGGWAMQRILACHHSAAVHVCLQTWFLTAGDKQYGRINQVTVNACSCMYVPAGVWQLLP